MADPFTRLIAISQQTERLLEQRFGAQGRGLHEKLSSVADRVPEKIQKKIRFIATIRNKATHEDVRIAKENLPAVRQAFAEVLPALDGGASKRRAALRKALIALGLIAAFAAFLALR
ncbi:MAG: hypothetical protein J6K25_02400 [Thermoguttaceae bacterium]|nr:hypothetical protein [Thermoguttaceae bacterium]